MPRVIPVCYCGNPAKLNMSWSNDNPGRSCFDLPLTPRSRFVVLGLLKKVRTLEDARKRERITWLLLLTITANNQYNIAVWIQTMVDIHNKHQFDNGIYTMADIHNKHQFDNDILTMTDTNNRHHTNK
ncbi:hypothetical protein J1N35_003869 [Gossypium stocksii]|uniref:Uncharacterized protein n=1 Tax=Gossypium stocksii TaxID=47602 RepID=A0A9D4AH51_9ROSI|nr:hypothetical protein J1N35_003869 [Gossypium stocksii]